VVQSSAILTKWEMTMSTEVAFRCSDGTIRKNDSAMRFELKILHNAIHDRISMTSNGKHIKFEWVAPTERIISDTDQAFHVYTSAITYRLGSFSDSMYKQIVPMLFAEPYDLQKFANELKLWFGETSQYGSSHARLKLCIDDLMRCEIEETYELVIQKVSNIIEHAKRMRRAKDE